MEKDKNTTQEETILSAIDQLRETIKWYVRKTENFYEEYIQMKTMFSFFYGVLTGIGIMVVVYILKLLIK